MKSIPLTPTRRSSRASRSAMLHAVSNTASALGNDVEPARTRMLPQYVKPAVPNSASPPSCRLNANGTACRPSATKTREPGTPRMCCCKKWLRRSVSPRCQRVMPWPPPDAKGLASHERLRIWRPARNRMSGAMNPCSRITADTSDGDRARISTPGGLPRRRLPRARRRTAFGWFSTLATDWPAIPAAARAMPNTSYRPGPGPSGRTATAGVPRLSRSANASTDAAVKPAAVADSTSARVEKPAIRTLPAPRAPAAMRPGLVNAEPAARGIRGDEEQVVEHGAGGLAQPEGVHEGFIRAAGQSVCNERGALCGFFGHARESGEAMHGRERAQAQPQLAGDRLGVR